MGLAGGSSMSIPRSPKGLFGHPQGLFSLCNDSLSPLWQEGSDANLDHGSTLLTVLCF